MTGWVAADSAINSTLVTAVVSIVVGLFGGGTLVALLRVNVDKGKVVIDAAQGAVVVQTGVIDSLQDDLARLRAERDGMREEMRELRAEVARLRAEGTDTAHRVARVEDVTGTNPGGTGT